MVFTQGKFFYGWVVVAASSFVVFGVAGSQFSFGVFLKPMTEEFGWSRATLATAFGVTFMLSGLLRPVAGYLADRYTPKTVALAGVALMGAMLLLLPYIQNLFHLYLIFAVMSVGLTLGMGPTLTKVISAWFYRARGVTHGIVSGGGSVGGLILVPATSAFLILLSWREAYLFLGLLLLVLVLPVGYLLIKNEPQDLNLEPQREDCVDESSDGDLGRPGSFKVADSTFKEALKAPIFWRLTAGYFV